MKIKLMFLFLSMAIAVTYAQTEKEMELMKDAANAKASLISKNEKIADYFEDAAGYVIFPNVGKGALIIGGASGNGIVYENGVAIGTAGLKKLDIGLQAGGQAIIEVIFFETQDDLNEFQTGEFEFSAQASAVVLQEGEAIKIKYKNGIAVFAMPKAGFMAEASIGGQKFSYENF